MWKGGMEGQRKLIGILFPSLGPPGFPLYLSGLYVVGKWEADNNFPQETSMAKVSPSGQFTFHKGNKSWSSTAGAAALELVDPLALGLGCHSLRPLFFFFFFFFLQSALNTEAQAKRPHFAVANCTWKCSCTRLKTRRSTQNCPLLHRPIVSA
eukprot:FR735878.1.p1 GENE.FR735878.1~~FR735878.1.p1  ORF type:complete len:153 (-),score=39.00 FR735878.1:518-976(-)